MSNPTEYRPTISSRRPEFGFWFLTFLSGAAWWVLASQGYSLSVFIPLFFILFLFVAAGTSLSNWMERRTRLWLSKDGIKFTNGLRNVSLNWDEILEMQVIPSRLGKSVHLIGTQGHFHFRMGGRVSVFGQERERIGFPQSDKILLEILNRTGLVQAEREQMGRFFVRPNSS